MSENERSTAKLTRRQEQAIAALLSEPTTEAAARKARISSGTIRRWQGEPTFNSALRQARQATLDTVISRLVSASTKAVGKLEALLDSGKPTVQLRSAVAILDRAIRGVDLLDLEARICALESRHGNAGQHAFERNGSQS